MMPVQINRDSMPIDQENLSLSSTKEKEKETTNKKIVFQNPISRQIHAKPREKIDRAKHWQLKPKINPIENLTEMRISMKFVMEHRR